jgi:hypothetical protein
MVKAGRMEWRDLERDGICLPARKKAAKRQVVKLGTADKPLTTTRQMLRAANAVLDEVLA